MTLGKRVRCAGFTIIEVMIALFFLAIVTFNAFSLLKAASQSTKESARVELDDQARRVLDQIAFAVMGANRETLFPEPDHPTHSTELLYEMSLGVEDGEIVWSDPEEIELSEGRVIWRNNPGQPEERRVVWCNVVRPFLEGEVLNGIDDNGNGLIDEQGLTFTLHGNTVRIRLTLERTDYTEETRLQSVETVVTLRN